MRESEHAPEHEHGSTSRDPADPLDRRLSQRALDLGPDAAREALDVLAELLIDRSASDTPHVTDLQKPP